MDSRGNHLYPKYSSFLMLFARYLTRVRQFEWAVKNFQRKAFRPGGSSEESNGRASDVVPSTPLRAGGFQRRCRRVPATENKKVCDVGYSYWRLCEPYRTARGLRQRLWPRLASQTRRNSPACPWLLRSSPATARCDHRRADRARGGWKIRRDRTHLGDGPGMVSEANLAFLSGRKTRCRPCRRSRHLWNMDGSLI